VGTRKEWGLIFDPPMITSDIATPSKDLQSCLGLLTQLLNNNAPSFPCSQISYGSSRYLLDGIINREARGRLAITQALRRQITRKTNILKKAQIHPKLSFPPSAHHLPHYHYSSTAAGGIFEYLRMECPRFR
jgi:hypothetical protein